MIDIKPSNILLVHTLKDEEIERWLETVPDDGKSHPLPCSIKSNITPHEAEIISVVLSDLGQCKTSISAYLWRSANRSRNIQRSAQANSLRSVCSAHTLCGLRKSCYTQTLGLISTYGLSDA